MMTQLGIGQALAELVKRLTPEEKREFVRWLGWEELEALRGEESVPSVAEGPVPSTVEGSPVEGMAEHPARRVGDPQVYVEATADGLVLELPVECVVAFVKRLPARLSVSSVKVYLRRNGQGEEHRVSAEELAGFLDTHQGVLLEGSLMLELDDAALVSGGRGCMLLTLEGISFISERIIRIVATLGSIHRQAEVLFHL